MGGTSAPQLPVALVGLVPYRPIGKNPYLRAPWVIGDPRDDYIPSEMSVEAAKIGLVKAVMPAKNFEEILVRRAEQYILTQLKSVILSSPEENVMTYEQALTYVKKDKSPGYPYVYKYDTKATALEKEGNLIRQRSDDMMDGKNVPSFFTITEKGELRAREKVEQGKTRLFFGSDMHHLITCYRLYGRISQRLHATRGIHPIMVGLQIPGPEFVSRMRDFVTGYDTDLSGCDQTFNLRVARSIMNLYHEFLPARYIKTGYNLFSAVFCGYCAGFGGMYRIYSNKSGWFGTTDVNSLASWMYFCMASYHFFPTSEPHHVMKMLIFGDDAVIRMLKGEFSLMRNWLLTHNINFEMSSSVPKVMRDLVFLSHHIEERFVAKFGDFLLAAGNLPKLLSSINWVKRSPNMSFEEGCVAHLIGVRLCLFPWDNYFQECDRILGEYISSIYITPFVRSILPARLSSIELAKLHTRTESAFLFLSQAQITALKTITSGLELSASLIEKSINAQIFSSKTTQATKSRPPN